MQHVKDPAAGVAPQLLPHLHLVSKYRYPLINEMSLQTVVGYLSEATKIVRDLQPVQWQFLDAPQDGSVFLVWQPLDYLGTNFASDGYVWLDAEHAFNSEARGYTIEMWLHRSGYHHPNEPVTSHCRRRYRLAPSKNPNLGLPTPDPHLWIVHYSRAERRDHIPSNQIPLSPQVLAMLNQRRILQSQGQLPRKEFMLHDRGNWPTINLPAAQVAQPFSQAQIGGTPNKAMPATRHARGPSGTFVPGDASLEEEEDVSRGDILDFMTPRDISKMRYEQHHEWMEEIVNSPYATKQIVPTDLGLGRKGELEALTNGFFEAPLTVMQEISANAPSARAGKMDAGQADEFATQAARKVADMKAELEMLKKRHARRMASLERTTILNLAEKRLRSAGNAADSQNFQGIFDRADDGVRHKPREMVDDVVRDVEASWGSRVVPLSSVSCVQRGGLLENRSEIATLAITSQSGGASPPKSNDKVEMRQSNSHHAEVSTNSTPAQEQATNSNTRHPLSMAAATDTLAGQSQEEGDQAELESPQSDHVENEPAVPSLADLDVEMEMDGIEGQSQMPDDDGADGNEWVMVPEEGGENNAPHQTTAEQLRPLLRTEDSVESSGVNFINTPGSGIHGLTPGDAGDAHAHAHAEMDDSALEPGDFDIHGDFDNVDVDTAGDALADYGAENEDLDLEGMDESAFGDAFHPRDETDTIVTLDLS